MQREERKVSSLHRERRARPLRKKKKRGETLFNAANDTEFSSGPFDENVRSFERG